MKDLSNKTPVQLSTFINILERMFIETEHQKHIKTLKARVTRLKVRVEAIKLQAR